MPRNKHLTYIGGHSLEANPIGWAREISALEDRLKAAVKADPSMAVRIAEQAIERVQARISMASDPIHVANLQRSLKNIRRIHRRLSKGD